MAERPSQASWPAVLESVPLIRRFVQEGAVGLGLSEKSARRLGLAAEEIAVNVARHAYRGLPPGPVAARLFRDKDRVLVAFTDSGRAFDPSGAPEPDLGLPASERPVGGLGLFLVKNIADELLYERVDGENRLTLVKRLSREDRP